MNTKTLNSIIIIVLGLIVVFSIRTIACTPPNCCHKEFIPYLNTFSAPHVTYTSRTVAVWGNPSTEVSPNVCGCCGWCLVTQYLVVEKHITQNRNRAWMNLPNDPCTQDDCDPMWGNDVDQDYFSTTETVSSTFLQDLGCYNAMVG